MSTMAPLIIPKSSDELNDLTIIKQDYSVLINISEVGITENIILEIKSLQTNVSKIQRNLELVFV